jgi:hypothetical protein
MVQLTPFHFQRVKILMSAVAPHKNAENAWNQLCIRTH